MDYSYISLHSTGKRIGNHIIVTMTSQYCKVYLYLVLHFRSYLNSIWKNWYCNPIIEKFVIDHKDCEPEDNHNILNSIMVKGI